MTQLNKSIFGLLFLDYIQSLPVPDRSIFDNLPDHFEIPELTFSIVLPSDSLTLAHSNSVSDHSNSVSNLDSFSSVSSQHANGQDEEHNQFVDIYSAMQPSSSGEDTPSALFHSEPESKIQLEDSISKQFEELVNQINAENEKLDLHYPVAQAVHDSNHLLSSANTSTDNSAPSHFSNQQILDSIVDSQTSNEIQHEFDRNSNHLL